jgi:hypothetical protein
MTKELTEVEAVAKAIAASRVPGSTLTLADVFSPELIGRTAQTAIEAHKAHLSASGCVIVPREPTEAMLKAADELPNALADEPWNGPEAADVYRAMLSALSPKTYEGPLKRAHAEWKAEQPLSDKEG